MCIKFVQYEAVHQNQGLHEAENDFTAYRVSNIAKFDAGKCKTKNMKKKPCRNIQSTPVCIYRLTSTTSSVLYLKLILRTIKIASVGNNVFKIEHKKYSKLFQIYKYPWNWKNLKIQTEGLKKVWYTHKWQGSNEFGVRCATEVLVSPATKSHI